MSQNNAFKIKAFDDEKVWFRKLSVAIRVKERDENGRPTEVDWKILVQSVCRNLGPSTYILVWSGEYSYTEDYDVVDGDMDSYSFNLVNSYWPDGLICLGKDELLFYADVLAKVPDLIQEDHSTWETLDVKLVGKEWDWPV